AVQGRVAQLEAGDLERLVLGQAVDAADAAVWTFHESPFVLAGHRVGIDLAQVALRGRLARVLEQVIERARVLGFPCQHVELDRPARSEERRVGKECRSGRWRGE